jgi:hypothetical protein
VYSVLGEQSSQVFATFIAGGTAGPFGDEVEPLQISDEAGPACELVRSKNAVESRCVTEAGAVLLGTAPDGRSDFAVTWIASHFTDTAVTTSVRGRLLRVGWNTHEFLTSQDTVDTQPVDLVTGANVRSATLVSIGKGKLALLWQELGRGLTTRWQVLDSRLRAASRPDLDVSSKSPPTDPRLAAAFDGKQLAVVWVEQAAEGRTRIVLRRVHTDGSDADDGSPVPIASSAGVQSAPAITVLADGRGFFVVWEETGGQGDESDLRAAALTADGAIRFVNPACDRAAFVLGNDSGPQHDPATTTLKNGSVLTVWTDGSSRGADHSRTAVWSAVLSPRELLPIE